MKLHSAVIGGYPGCGKTVMLLHLASIVLSQGYTALYIGHENHNNWIKDLSERLEFDLGGLKVLHAPKFNTDPTIGQDLQFDYIFLDDTYLFGDEILSNLIAKFEARGSQIIFTCQLDIADWKALYTIQWKSLCNKYPLLKYDKFMVNKYGDIPELVLMENDKVIERLRLK